MPVLMVVCIAKQMVVFDFKTKRYAEEKNDKMLKNFNGKSLSLVCTIQVINFFLLWQLY